MTLQWVVRLGAFAVLANVALGFEAQTEPTRPAGGAERAGQAEDGQGTKRRIELNLLGKTDAGSGESRRNENVAFNLVDNNALKELNIRLGTTATIVREFAPDRGYYGAEFGNAPAAVLSIPAPLGAGFHGNVRHAHVNSVSGARSFFQVGDVEPARENDYGLTLGGALWRGARLFFDGGRSASRGSVNGNVLVPKADERTPLATHPDTRALVVRYLGAYPVALPNRTDVNPRALNTNSPQSIDNDNATVRVEQGAGGRDSLRLLYQFTSQRVDAFQLVSGQNPDTDTRAHRALASWSRRWSSSTVTDLAFGFDRVGSYLRPEEHAVGRMVSVSGLETLGPQGSIPIDRAQNLFRYAGQWRRGTARHAWSAGFGVVRRQTNGVESDAHRGFISFSSDFGQDSITNLRLGAPTQYIVSLGTVHRGFRNWDLQFHTGDVWQAARALTVSFGLRYQPVPRPNEVNGIDAIAYDCDCNNVAPQFGLAARLPRGWGVLRAAYGLQFGEIFPVTFQQIRFGPPGSVKYVVTAPSLVNPLEDVTPDGRLPNALGNLYLLDPELATAYSHQYNASWEPGGMGPVKLEFGYVGSRSHKLLSMWYLNRARPVAGIPQTSATINQRRPDPQHADIRRVVNGSRGYFDAGRISLVLPYTRGLALNAAYWYSKALDLGSSYTNTAADNDSRLGRSQSEVETHRDLKAPSAFDQTHALLLSGTYAIPVPLVAAPAFRLVRGWTLSAVALYKTGIPFNVSSGADGPGFGNVDGNGSDRPNLVDVSILGRTVGHPDSSRSLLPRGAFSFMQATDTRGNLGRNVFRRGGIRNVNAALAREWGIGRDRKLGFRVESINLFNTPQFAEPGSELANGNFGQITNTLNDGRTFRFELKLRW